MVFSLRQMISTDSMGHDVIVHASAGYATYLQQFLLWMCFYFDDPLSIMCVYRNKVHVVAHNELQVNTAFILARGPWLLPM